MSEFENAKKVADAWDRLQAQLTAARAEVDRLLTLTSEQATEIVGKDKAISDATDWLTDANVEIIDLKAEVERQSVLLGKAKKAIAGISTELKLAAKYFHERIYGAAEIEVDMARDLAHAVLSELQAKP